MRLRYAPKAARELDALLTHLAEESPQGARRVAAAIRRAEQVLLDHPHIGQRTSARPPLVRRLVVRPSPYILFYELSDDVLSVIGIRHGARDPSTMPGQP